MNIEIEDYFIDKNINLLNKDSYNSSLIYGEVDVKSCIKIIKNKILDKYFENNYEYINFVDIGSGCGKLVLKLAEYNIFSSGVEILNHRYLKSNYLLNNSDDDNLYNYIDFINDNYINIYFGNYNVLYCCNIIFSMEDNNLLYDKLLKEFHGYAILYCYNNKINNYLIGKDYVKTSWHNNVEIFIFHFKKN